MKFSINNLNIVYSNGKAALRNVSLELTSPSFIGLLGPNGAGKSTLMKLLTCQLLPTDGSITCDNAPLNSQELTLKKQLGYLPQRFEPLEPTLEDAYMLLLAKKEGHQ